MGFSIALHFTSQSEHCWGLSLKIKYDNRQYIED